MRSEQGVGIAAPQVNHAPHVLSQNQSQTRLFHDQSGDAGAERQPERRMRMSERAGPHRQCGTPITYQNPKHWTLTAINGSMNLMISTRHVPEYDHLDGVLYIDKAEHIRPAEAKQLMRSRIDQRWQITKKE